MFGIGMPELIIILAVALIVIGPKKLPDLAKSLGRALGEFKKATNDLKDSIYMNDEIKDVKNTLNNLKDDSRTSISEILDDHKEVEESSPASEPVSESDSKPNLEIDPKEECLHDTPEEPLEKLKMTADELSVKTENSAADSLKKRDKE